MSSTSSRRDLPTFQFVHHPPIHPEAFMMQVQFASSTGLSHPDLVRRSMALMDHLKPHQKVLGGLLTWPKDTTFERRAYRGSGREVILANVPTIAQPITVRFANPGEPDGPAALAVSWQISVYKDGRIEGVMVPATLHHLPALNPIAASHPLFEDTCLLAGVLHDICNRAEIRHTVDLGVIRGF